MSRQLGISLVREWQLSESMLHSRIYQWKFAPADLLRYPRCDVKCSAFHSVLMGKVYWRASCVRQVVFSEVAERFFWTHRRPKPCASTFLKKLLEVFRALFKPSKLCLCILELRLWLQSWHSGESGFWNAASISNVYCSHLSASNVVILIKLDIIYPPFLWQLLPESSWGHLPLMEYTL